MTAADFPKSMVAFVKRFGTEEACVRYLRLQKWGTEDGFECPRCGHKGCWEHETRKRRLTCRACRAETSVTAGTAFHDSRIGLHRWFLAMYLMSTSKQGVSAKEIQRQLGLGSYQTAWTILHKLRRCMVDPSRTPLSGMVEMDETYIGGAAVAGEHGRSTAKKTAVVCAVERVGMGTGRCRLAVIENCTKAKLQEFADGVLKAGTTAHTDGWRGYLGMERSGYAHIRAIADKDTPAHVLLPSVHRIFSLLKRVMLGTHQGAVSRKHLQHYLHEYEFRFNRRKSHTPCHLFQRLSEGVAREGHSPYWRIVGRVESRTPVRA
jgi:transposase-like protein/transcription elongation factor Elf1